MPDPYSSGSDPDHFTISSAEITLNEDALARAFDDMQREEDRFHPSLGEWIATAASSLGFYFIIATASFHTAGGFNGGDVHTLAVVVFVLFGLATLVLLPWWAIHGLTHRTKLTADDMVARLKAKAREQQLRSIAADKRVDRELTAAVGDVPSHLEWLTQQRIAMCGSDEAIGLDQVCRVLAPILPLWKRDIAISAALVAAFPCPPEKALQRVSLSQVLGPLKSRGLVEEIRQTAPPPQPQSGASVYMSSLLHRDPSFSEFRWTPLGQAVVNRLEATP